MNNKIVLLSTFAILGVLVLGQVACAANSILSVSPITASKSVGTAFNVAVNLDPQGNKVCVVKGILNFDKLSCQSVTVAGGIMAQIAPTCASPSFVLGIKSCTTLQQDILSVSVKGTSVGQANLSVTGAKVIGAGVIVASGLQSGTYNITAVKTVEPKIITLNTPSVENSQTTSGEVVTPASVASTNADLTANVGLASVASSGIKWFYYLFIIIGILIIMAIIYTVYYLVKKKKK